MSCKTNKQVGLIRLKKILCGSLLFGLIFCLITSVSAYNNSGGGVCNCSSCDDCKNSLNDNNCNIAYLIANISNYAGTCIDNPANFNNKVFDCQGWTIDGDGTGYGIYSDGRNNVTIKNCKIRNCSVGIYILGSYTSKNNIYVTDNIISSNDYGIKIYASSSNIINNNLIFSNNYGIHLEFSESNKILNNLVYSNKEYGIFQRYYINNNYSNNKACINYNYDIYVTNAGTNYFNNNTCDNKYNSICEYNCSYNFFYPDLTISSLTLSPEHPLPNEEVIVSALIENRGYVNTIGLDKVNVSLYIDGYYNYSKIIDMFSISQKEVNFSWIASIGNHTLKTGFDTANIADSNKENDNSSVNVSMPLFCNQCCKSYLGYVVTKVWSSDSFIMGGRVGSIAVDDTDDDGKMEIIAGDYGNHKIYIFENTGDNNYTKIWDSGSIMQGNIQSIVTGDTDDDGKIEIIATSGEWPTDNKVYVFENTGDNTYTKVWDNSDSGVSIGSYNLPWVMLGDTNNNGKKEIIVNAGTSYRTYVFENTGDNTYGLICSGSCDVPSEAQHLLDMDQDGRDEKIGIYGTFPDNKKIYVYENRGRNNYIDVWNSASIIVGFDYDFAGLTVADADKDGKDEMIAGNGDSEVYILEVEPAYYLCNQTITVCKNGTCDYLSIQDAIDNADCGEIVKIVDNSIYNENIVWKKDRVTLDCNGAVLDGGISVQYNKGIEINGKNNNLIKNCNIRNYFYGIELYDSSGNIVFKNNLSYNTEGIGLFGSHNNIIDGNNANHNTLGVEIFMSSGNTINNMVANSNSQGIIIWDSSNNIVANNIVNNNDEGIYLKSSSNNNIADNTANSNTHNGIYLSSSSNNTLTKNTVNSNHNNGISLDHSSNNNINTNIVCGNTNHDFYSPEWLLSSGDNNTCDKQDGWNDTGAIGCTNKCITELKTYSVSLNYGWNLISIPITPKNTSIKSVLASVEGKYTKVGAWTGGSGKHYIPGFPFNTLTDINEEMGFWIKMNQTATLTVEGYTPDDRAIPLQVGWNLVGYLSTNKNQPLAAALSSISGKYTKVGAWINGTGKHYIPGFPFNTLINMSEGYGYWIKMNASDVLEYKYPCINPTSLKGLVSSQDGVNVKDAVVLVFSGNKSFEKPAFMTSDGHYFFIFPPDSLSSGKSNFMVLASYTGYSGESTFDITCGESKEVNITISGLTKKNLSENQTTTQSETV